MATNESTRTSLPAGGLKKKPNYRAMSIPKIATAPYGKKINHLNRPRGIAYSEKTEEIFIADEANARIQIFSISGELVHVFGENHLKQPANILIHDESIFVTDWGWQKDSLFVFEFSNLKYIKKVGKNGFKPDKEYNLLRQPRVTPSGEELYIPDNNNNRIIAFDIENLDVLRHLTHESIPGPRDLVFSKDRLFVLNNSSEHCVHVFTLNWDKQESIITRSNLRKEWQMIYPCHFCIDISGNFVISDFERHSVSVFSPSGETLYKIGSPGPNKGQFDCPTGVAVTLGGSLIVVSENDNYGLQIY